MTKHESYEYNLKLYNESIRKDLDITLTSTIPTQKNLMKTILWINTSIIGLTLTALAKNLVVIYISIPFIFSSIAIGTILFALKDGRVKSFGTPSIKQIENIKPDHFEKINGLIVLNESIEKALNNNIALISNRAAKIAFSTNMTIVSLISIFLMTIFIVNLYLMKGGN